MEAHQASLMDGAKTRFEQQSMELRHAFSEMFNATEAIMQSNIQEVQQAVKNCTLQHALLNDERSRVSQKSISHAKASLSILFSGLHVVLSCMYEWSLPG